MFASIMKNHLGIAWLVIIIQHAIGRLAGAPELNSRYQARERYASASVIFRWGQPRFPPTKVDQLPCSDSLHHLIINHFT